MASLISSNQTAPVATSTTENTSAENINIDNTATTTPENNSVAPATVDNSATSTASTSPVLVPDNTESSATETTIETGNSASVDNTAAENTTTDTTTNNYPAPVTPND